MPIVKPALVNMAYSDRLVWGEWQGKHPLDHVRGPYDFDGRMYDEGVDCSHFLTADGEVVETPSLTRQSEKDDCDINVMMAKYQTTGVEPRSNPRAPQWGDFSNVPAYQEALDIVRQADDDFALLPAEVRERFGNNPTGMLRFLSDEANRDEAIKLGLVMPPPVEPPPQKVHVVNSTPDADASRESVTAKGTKSP